MKLLYSDLSLYLAFPFWYFVKTTFILQNLYLFSTELCLCNRPWKQYLPALLTLSNLKLLCLILLPFLYRMTLIFIGRPPPLKINFQINFICFFICFIFPFSNDFYSKWTKWKWHKIILKSLVTKWIRRHEQFVFCNWNHDNLSFL